MGTSNNTAILLAAGKGSRMGGDTPKQYRMIGGMPLAARSLKALGESDVIDDIVMVIPPGDEAYVREKIFPFVSKEAKKVRCFALGGRERYDSVFSGLTAISWPCDYVFIHDGARPFIDGESLLRLERAVRECGACVAGMPSKDTVKIVDEQGFVAHTPDREKVWIVQTPQVFERELILKSYTKMMEELPNLNRQGIHITDDAMAVELMMHTKVKLVEASYQNIKVTTPDDIAKALAYIGRKED